MAEFRYKAFISYSHADEGWAKWLHRALETYRVPRHLVGTTGPCGKVNKRVAPVFRDRDDLATATSLSNRLAEALQDSSALIIICSPAAVASRWVDEEVRRYQALGRADRVFCMLVDGDASKGDCFPPSLFDGVDDAEPLFADPRDWADGKRLARQKIVAGLLGVSLDEIRQRDLKRRRKFLTIATLVVVAALALTTITVTSRISEQNEREKAEQLATFVVDLGERLKSDVDLETRNIIGQEAMRHLETLDFSKLVPATRAKVGLALRQIGWVHEGQGRPREALDSFQRSRELFRDLARQFPEEKEFLFELSQAAFYVFYFHSQRGEFKSAVEPMNAYAEIAKQLYDDDPSNRQWLLEVSYSTANSLAWQVASQQPASQAMLNRAEEAVGLAERSVAAWDGNAEVLAHLSTTLAWAADASLAACQLNHSMEYRGQTLELATQASRGSPSSLDLKLVVAWAHSGVAMVRTELGELDAAELHRRASLALLEQLQLSDPSNVVILENQAYRRFLFSRLLGETGREVEALEVLQQAINDFVGSVAPAVMSSQQSRDYAEMLLAKAELLERTGSRDEALGVFEQATQLLVKVNGEGKNRRDNGELIMQARALGWEITGMDPAKSNSVFLAYLPVLEGDYRSCKDAVIASRFAIMNGDRESAVNQARYLAERSYKEPGYIRFCRTNNLCD